MRTEAERKEEEEVGRSERREEEDRMVERRTEEPADIPLATTAARRGREERDGNPNQQPNDTNACERNINPK